jgi:dienelactone hydrolase
MAAVLGISLGARAAEDEPGLLAPANGYPARPETGKLRVQIGGLDHPNAYCLMGVPKNYTPTRNWPLVLVLHGGPKGRPDDLASVFRAGLMEQGAICVFPKALQVQLLEWNYPHSSAYLLEIIKQVSQKYRIDPRRLYLVGHSMGGGGTWVNAAVLRDVWAAVGPMSGWYGASRSPSSKWLQDMPVYCIHGEKDRAVPALLSRRAFEALDGLGMKTKTFKEFPKPEDLKGLQGVYRELQGVGHNIFDPWKKRGSKEIGLMVAWLLAHKRPQPANLAAAEKRLAEHGRKLFEWTPGERLGKYSGQPALPSAEDIERAKESHKLRKQLRDEFKKKEYAKAEATCRKLVELSPKDNAHHYNLACAQAQQGKTDEALASLLQAAKLGYANTKHMQQDPDLASLRRDPRFAKLIEAIKKAHGK